MECNSFQMAVVPQAWLQCITDKLEQVEKILNKQKEQNFNNEWIESAKAKEMLGVSQKTWQTYRDQRVISFSQVGRKIYVKRADLETFMQQHYISARGQKGGRNE